MHSAKLAIQGGAVMLQYRDKQVIGKLHRLRRLKEAHQLSQLCRDAEIPFLVNDDVALAAASGASGVHLGRQDLQLHQAQEQLSEDAIIGLSCYNSLARARLAIKEGASYIAFGALFASPTKPKAPIASLLTLQAAKRFSPIPITAIGGITPKNAGCVAAAGADLIAVISNLFGAQRIDEQAERLAKAWRASASR